ncbi:RNA 2',3'-cyclic phosphodiesterase [Usitatibacter palustris]|uniref:RNA 2',3'-cyclic phosphodiesterase n=1 Tax=Usitatibacter palustris TaxID=2732487 RepID=A0A6M4HE21_9PROT|nr:RNA 2',3'-cyclic phosphodiesterase [Usitatibacter palustris]QJR16864.1 RNA 2',3'-cyclic phosphodiesterase [Usitatibacter palustris]
MARLFFALRPSAPALAALAALGESLARQSGGRAVPAAKIHLTLAFLGEVEPQRVAMARGAADAVGSERFEARCDQVGSFRGAGVAWAGMSEMPAGLVRLAASLAARLRDAGFVLETRPFVPHLTLVRRVERAVPVTPIAPIAWTMEGFSLVESDLRSGRYVERGSWGGKQGTR